jgi:hypothetical protein
VRPSNKPPPIADAQKPPQKHKPMPPLKPRLMPHVRQQQPKLPVWKAKSWLAHKRSRYPCE